MKLRLCNNRKVPQVMRLNKVVPLSKKAKAEDTEKLKQVLSKLDLGSCPYQYNFHMHTFYSDGKLHPIELIKQAISIGLKGLAITDHHSVKGYQTVQEWLEEQAEDTVLPHLWTGLEVTSELLDVEVHILAYGFSPEYPGLSPYLQGESPTGEMAKAAKVIETIHQARGIAVLAHPVRYHSTPEDLILAASQVGIDGVESFYAYGNPKPWQPSLKETERVLDLSKSYGLLNTCGTDTHGLDLLQRI